MELRQLEYLVAVADEGGFTRAAERLNVTQPGISAQIKLLEREVGHRLFDRASRSVTPTSAGGELLEHARAILDRLDQARASMDALAGLVRGRVTVGVTSGAPLGRLATLLARFRVEHPGVDVTVREAGPADLLGALVCGEVDLALVGLVAGDDPAGITAHVLLDERLVALVGRGDPWLHRSTATLEEVAGRTLIGLPQATGVRAAFESACAGASLRPQAAYEVSTPAAAIELAREGLGVALVPEAAAEPHGGGLRVVTIIRPMIRSRLVLAWSSAAATTGRPAARALIRTTAHDLARSGPVGVARSGPVDATTGPISSRSRGR